MITDLTAVRDHPGTLLTEHFAPMQEAFRTDGAAHFKNAAAALALYEQQHNVTFAALDNQALADVRAAYQVEDDSPEGLLASVNALRHAVDALLGMGD